MSLLNVKALQKKQKNFPPNTTDNTEIHRRRIFVSVTSAKFGGEFFLFGCDLSALGNNDKVTHENSIAHQ
jgi:hypothetical protein